MVAFTSSLTTILAFYFLSFAASSPLDARTDPVTTAKYDDLTQSPVAAVPIGNYQGLSYNAFFVVTQGLLGIKTIGVKFTSSPNAAGYGVYGGLLTGKVPSINAIGSQTFTLRSFYFGCTINTAESVAGIATPCTVTANGYNKDGQKFSLDFNFNPGSTKLAPLQLASFPNTWTRLTSVSFVTSGAVGQTLIGTEIDNVSYTIQK